MKKKYNVTPLSKDEIFSKLQRIMQELFEVSTDDLKLDSKLYDDLDLDSIDAIDLIAQLQTITGRKFNPEEFKSVRTIEDIRTYALTGIC